MKLILSFALIVSIATFSMLSVFFTVFGERYRENVESRNLASMRAMAANFEEQIFIQTQKTALEMLSNEKIYGDLLSALNVSGVHKTSMLTAVKDKFWNFNYQNTGNYYDIILYASKQNVMVSKCSGVYYLNSVSRKNPDSVWWFSALVECGESQLWTTGNLNPYMTEEGLVLILAYPQWGKVSREELIGALSLQINKSVLDVFFEKNSIPGAELFLISPSGDVVFSTNSEMRVASDALNQTNSGAWQVTVVADGQEAFVYSASNLPSGFKLLSVTPETTFYGDFYSLRLAYVFVSIGVFLIVMVVSYLLTQRLYRPIVRLRTQHAGHANPADAKSHDELADIGFAFGRLEDHANELEETLKRNTPLIREAYLNRLIHRRPGAVLDARILEGNDRVDLSGPRTGVMMIRFREDDALLQNEIVLYALIGRIEWLATQTSYRLYAFKTYNNDIAILMNCALNEVDARMVETEIVNSVRQFVYERFALAPRIFIGGFATSIPEIADAYARTLKLARMVFITPKKQVFSMDDEMRGTDDAEAFDWSLISRFEKALAARNEADAIRALGEVIDMCESGRYSYDMCMSRLNGLENILTAFLFKERLTTETEGTRVSLSGCADVEEAREMMEDTLKLAFDRLDARARGCDELLVERVTKYIEERLSENPLIEDTAEVFRISPNYLRKLLKEKYAQTYTEYVTHRKLEASKELLEKTNMLVDEIGASVGFGSSAYYIKLFRAKYGVTPKTYRVNIAISNEKL